MSLIDEQLCPACAHHLAALLLEPTNQPLATLGWPESRENALAMEALPLTFARCLDCGHVWNTDFTYELVPYTQNPNFMFNDGCTWLDHVSKRAAEVASHLSENGCMVEVGYGDGSFISHVNSLIGDGNTLVGFDPHGQPPSSQNARLRFQSELFEPSKHIAELRPEVVVSRHVLEHLADPLRFLQRLDHACLQHNVRTWTYLEVPCIDIALKTGRFSDFYFEHNSHFTTQSFTRMLERSGADDIQIGYDYEGEVIFAFVLMGTGEDKQLQRMNDIEAYRHQSVAYITKLRQDLDKLIRKGVNIAIWGGTGKSAAFLNALDVNPEDLPLVVDSDERKVGTYVPGLGQLIRSPGYLIDNPVDVVLIPTYWRAKDIHKEMERKGIQCEKIIVAFRGNFITLEV